MQHLKRLLVIVVFIVVVLQLAACGADEGPDKIEPAHVEEIEGSEFNLVTLTEKAAERLDIQSEATREEEIEGEMKMVVPYSAVIYGLHGETWAYVRNPGPNSLTFVRHPITVEYIDGGLAILADGPPVGTEVVTVGAQMLYGTDTGVGK
ncbi:MAG TPA: hypothetical protein VLE70_22520 [Anaerolineae bacterium]|jgi:hypothetical protein|nr:hypothetical protein [Anaerolineae bacterium]